MNFVVLTEEQFHEIIEKLDRLEAKMMDTKVSIIDNQIDNDQFCQRMKISKRTAQSWRDESRLPFTQINGKIYYDVTEVETFFNNHKVLVQDVQRRHKRSKYSKPS